MKMMKKLICLILLTVSVAALFINKNVQQAQQEKVSSDLKYLLTVEDSSKNGQYKEITGYDSSNNIKINSAKKINKPLFSLNKDIKESAKNRSDYVDVNNYSDNRNDSTVNNDELELLAHLIESEAGDETFEGKIAVGDVVLNRMKRDSKDMENIIYAKSQFNGVETSNFSIQPSADSLEAALKALNGLNLVPDAYYFANLNLCDPEFALKEKFIVRIGGHWFFRK